MRNMSRLTDPELELMLVIWNSRDKVSTSEIRDGLKEEKTVQWVQNYLNRLEEKGFIRCEKLSKRLNHYTTLIGMDEYRARETLSIVDKLYDSSPTMLFATLLKNTDLSEEQVEDMKKMLEEGR